VLTSLTVPFLDIRAGALGWWLGEAPPSLGELVLEAPHGRLALRLLGASHQAVAEVGGTRVPEVVACNGGGPLPRTRAVDLDGGSYLFASTTSVYGDRGLARVARDLRRHHTGSPHALVGAFPGSPHALTALQGKAVPDGWAWRSWHVYPGSGEVVRTRSSLVVRSRSREIR
jgi:hypothetical protein